MTLLTNADIKMSSAQEDEQIMQLLVREQEFEAEGSVSMMKPFNGQQHAPGPTEASFYTNTGIEDPNQTSENCLPSQVTYDEISTPLYITGITEYTFAGTPGSAPISTSDTSNQPQEQPMPRSQFPEDTLGNRSINEIWNTFKGDPSLDIGQPPSIFSYPSQSSFNYSRQEHILHSGREGNRLKKLRAKQKEEELRVKQKERDAFRLLDDVISNLSSDIKSSAVERVPFRYRNYHNPKHSREKAKPLSDSRANLVALASCIIQ
jgi:hypothetical protein